MSSEKYVRQIKESNEDKKEKNIKHLDNDFSISFCLNIPERDQLFKHGLHFLLKQRFNGKTLFNLELSILIRTILPKQEN